MKRLIRYTEGIVAALAIVLGGQTHAADAITGQDKEFIKNAAELGLTEVETGRLAEQKATSPDLKKFGARMVADHSKVNDELMALAKAKGVDVKAELTSSQKKEVSGLSEKSGAEFDKEYREHQIKDHEKAIKAFTKASTDAKDPEVKAFAAKHLPHLQEHLMMIQGGADSRTTKAGEERRVGTNASTATRTDDTVIKKEGRGQKVEGQVKTQ
jgi:putative membrane protein